MGSSLKELKNLLQKGTLQEQSEIIWEGTKVEAQCIFDKSSLKNGFSIFLGDPEVTGFKLGNSFYPVNRGEYLFVSVTVPCDIFKKKHLQEIRLYKGESLVDVLLIKE